MPWSGLKRVDTARGPRMVRSVSVPMGHRFWDYWKSDGWRIKKAGFSLNKYRGQWQLTHWIQEDAKSHEIDLPNEVELEGEIEAPKQNPALSDTLESRLADIAPKLLKYQVPAARAISQAMVAFNSAFDASDTGVGKTYVALATCYIMGRNPGIICPKSIIPSWRKVCASFGLNPVFVANYEAVKTAKFQFGEFIKDGKRERFAWNVPPLSLLIFDECQKAKTQRTANAKLLVGARNSNLPIICLSATAATSPVEMYALGYVLGLHNGKNYYEWASKYGVRASRFGFVFSGKGDSLKRLHAEIFPLHGNRIRIADLGNQFPETQITAQPYDTGNAKEIEGVYDEMFSELAELEVREGMSAAERRSNMLVVQLRARQKTELLKVPVFCQLAQDAVENGMQVAIFVNFIATLEAIAGRLKTKCIIKGGQSVEERQNSIEGFQMGSQQYIVSQIQSGGVGVSLHGKNRLALISPTWSAIDLKQALGRVHRAGGDKSIQKIVYAAETIEEDVCERVKVKLEMISAINDGDLALGKIF